MVCAAIRKGRIIIASPRHYDEFTHNVLCALHPSEKMYDAEQGFIDQWGKFMTREEAFEVASAVGQIIKKTGNPDSKELFSEDIY